MKPLLSEEDQALGRQIREKLKEAAAALFRRAQQLVEAGKKGEAAKLLRQAEEVWPDVKGLRITPNVYTTLDEIDTFADCMEEISKSGGVR